MSIRVTFLGGPQDGFQTDLPEPLMPFVIFPRILNVRWVGFFDRATFDPDASAPPDLQVAEIRYQRSGPASYSICKNQSG